MKKFYAWLLLLVAYGTTYAQAPCGAGQLKVVVQITPDNFPQETTWSLYDEFTHTLIDTGNVQGDSACVAVGRCIKFTIFDSQNDGLCCGYGNGSYTVTLGGNVVASGGNFGNRQTTYFNCPAGTNCSNPIAAGIDTFTAPAPETWYTFTPDTTGTYIVSTCNLGNTCDTKLYIYDYCTGLVASENNQATIFYDDDGCQAGFQSRISGVFNAGTTYYIRIGDYNTACAGQTIKWQIQSLGPVQGCTDTASCNYNPLATIDDGSCLYAPNPLCAQPDLAIDINVLESSMYVADIDAGSNNCYVSEGCLSGYGNRRLIRFSTHIRNIGNQDYFIGLPDTASGQYVFDACHGHYHYVGYAEYLVYDANHQPLQQGFKNGFCVLDLECGGGGMAKFNCSNMGITAGCGDIYDAGLDCQWIDITDIDTGNYTLVVRVNWDQSPDRLGHYEKTYANNWAQVCLHLYYDQGYKVFEILPNCVPYTDCAGDTFGNAVTDCNYQCNGSGVRGDVDINLTADTLDLNMYLEGIKEDTLKFSTCNDLNGDSLITVTDAARLNACLLNNAGTHQHDGNYQNTHKHCEFPHNIYNPFDSVTFSIADTNLEQHYIDLSVHNPTCQLLAYEFTLHGLVVDSIKNLALGNYTPDIRASASGHVVGISADENSLFKQLVPLNFMRVYFSALTDTFICIDKVIAAVNGNYEEVLGKHTGCVQIAQPVEDTTIIISAPAITADMFSVIPNPSTGVFQLYLQGKSLQGAALKVTDALGKTVYQNTNTGLSNQTTIDLSEQQAGVYLLHLDLNGARMNKRLLVR